MAERNALFVSDTGGVDTVEDVRLGLGALMMPGVSSIATQTGLRPGPIDPGLVTASGTADKFVHIAPMQAFVQSTRATAPGMYVETNDAAKALDLLTLNPANATNPRNDLIIAQQSDKFYTDTSNGWVIKQVVGTPSGSPVDPTVTGSPDYFTLARVRVGANVTTITTGNITDLRPGFTVALGGILPVPSVTVRNALAGKYDGFPIYRRDRKWIEIYDGTAWRVHGTAIVANIADLAAITDPLTGQTASNSADGYRYRYTGSAWVAIPVGLPAAVVTTSSNGTPTTSTTETVDAILGVYTFTAVPGVTYEAKISGRSCSSTVANDRFSLKLKYTTDGTTPTAASTLIGHDSVIVDDATGGGGAGTLNHFASFMPVASGGANTTVKVACTWQRVTGSGVGTPQGAGQLYVLPIGSV